MAQNQTHKELKQRIVELEKVQEALKEREEKCRRLVENSPDMLYRMSLPDGKYEFVSSAAEKIFGYPPENWYANPLLIREIIHSDFDSYFSEQWQNLINGKVPPAYEYKIIHKDKRERWINQRNILVKDEQGRPVALEGVVTDITARKAAEQALRGSEELRRQSEKKLKSTLDATPFPVAVVDLKDDKIFYWSSSALKLFGHTAPTASEWYEIAYPDPEYRQAVIAKWKSFLEIARTSGEPVNTGEYRVTCKDGTERICELYATFLPDNLVVTFNDITDRKRAEEDRAQIFTMSLDMICVADIDTATFIKVNPAFTETLGYSEEELLEQPFFDFIHPDDIDVTRTVIDRRLRKGAKVINFENRYRCKDGSYRWLSWVSHPNVEKGITFAVARDVTEWKKNEEALRKSKTLLDATGRMAKVGGWELDAKTMDVTWTEETYRIHEAPFGYKPPLQEAINYFHPEDRGRLAQAIQRALDQGEPYDLELRFITAKGNSLWTRTMCQPEVVDGNVVKLKGTFQDITDRKRIEMELIESERRFRDLAEMLPEAIFEADLDMKLTYVNKRSFSLFGYTVQDFNSGLNALDMLVSEDRGKARANMLRRIKGEQFEASEYQGLKKDGTAFPILLHASPVYDKGHVKGIRGVIVDISSRKQMERQLLQSQKLESVGNLAGGIAHDFNNILSSIIGFTELVLDDVEKGSQTEDNLQQVYAAGKRAKDLVKQILAFARQSDEKLEPVEVGSVAKEVLKFIRSSIPTTIEIKQSIQSDSLIMGNQTQVHLALMNLCTNAAHAMQNEGGTLEVHLRDVAIDRPEKARTIGITPGEYVEIKVSDTGSGIPPDIIGSIFEPYFTTKASGEGTGMGLAMVHGIVESYAGKIAVDSTLGKGTVFTLHLPITRKRKLHRSYESETLPSGTERILYVDDEPSIAKMGTQILARLGYEVTTRTSSVEALELFRSNPTHFDLVITDMTMPNMTGDKLAIELMKIRSDVCVILCTGFSNKMSDEIASEIGVKALAYKPVVKADLARTVRNVLDEAKGTTP